MLRICCTLPAVVYHEPTNQAQWQSPTVVPWQVHGTAPATPDVDLRGEWLRKERDFRISLSTPYENIQVNTCGKHHIKW